MKLNTQKVKEAEKWVEQNGLYPQRCGASVKLFCKAMGINYSTYCRWLEKADFANALTRAREVFKQNTIREVTNALVKVAKGFEFSKIKEERHAQIVKEFDPQTGRKIREYNTENQVTVKSYHETIYFPPDVSAAKFVLTNLDPDNWKNRQDNVSDMSVEFDDAPPVIVFSDSSTSMES